MLVVECHCFERHGHFEYDVTARYFLPVVVTAITHYWSLARIPIEISDQFVCNVDKFRQTGSSGHKRALESYQHDEQIRTVSVLADTSVALCCLTR